MAAQKITSEIGNVGNLGMEIIQKEFSKDGMSYNLFNFAVSNFIVLFLVIVTVFLIYLGYSFLKNKKKNKKEITKSGTIDYHYVDDETVKEREPIKKKEEIEMPLEINKYSFMFNLIIDDFYCNKGIWKCIMLHGDLGNIYSPKVCKSFQTEETRKLMETITRPMEKCHKYICTKEADDYEGKGNDKKKLEKKLEKGSSLEERIELICGAIKSKGDNDEGKKLLACGMSKCGQIEGKNMLMGHAMSFIDKHTEYCNQVFTENKIKTDDKLYSDQFDNKCSNKQLIAKYPHLIPSNQELDLILNSDKLANSGQLNRDDIDKLDDLSYDKKDDITNSSDDCWNDLVKNIRAQSPGIWLHPFINNLRIVITTFSEKLFDDEKDKHKFSHVLNVSGIFDPKDIKNYKVEEINECSPGPSDLCEINLINLRERNSAKKIYREYFDIKNIPIKELFHIAVVLNENLCEVYINSKLVRTQILFGSPEFIKGHIYLNPKLKEKNNLNGKIIDFKFVNRLVNHYDLKSVVTSHTSIEDSSGKINILDEEHEHDIKHVHSHKFHHDDSSHNHTLEEIPTEH